MVTVLDSKDLLTHLQTGETPVPKEVAEDNARQKERAENKGEKPTEKVAETKAAEPAAKETKPTDDDVEGEDGLTPKQKREFSAAMLKSIGKKHREKLEAEEFAADQYNQRRLAESRAAELEEQLAALQSKSAPKVEEKKEPKREDYQSDAEYDDARIDYRADLRIAERDKNSAIARSQEEQQQIIIQAQDRLRKAAELVPDFQEVTEGAELQVPGHIAAYMQRSPLFAELGYHFAKHPEVLADLRKMNPGEALVELGVIKSTLKLFAPGSVPSSSPDAKASTSNGHAASNGGEPSTPTESTRGSADPSKSRSPAPVVTPLQTSSTAQVEKPVGSLNTREMIEKWQKDNGRNLHRRSRH